MSDKEKRNPDIGLIYPKDMFSAEELSEYNRELEAAGLSFGALGNQTSVQACLGFFVPLIKIFLSPAFISAFLTSVLSAIAWDSAKAVIRKICKSIAENKPRRFSNGRIENIEAPIQIIVGNVRVVLPADSSDEVIQHTVDKAFEYLLKETSTEELLYALYDEASDRFKSYMEREILDRIIAEHRAEQNKDDIDVITIQREQDIKEQP